MGALGLLGEGLGTRAGVRLGRWDPMGHLEWGRLASTRVESLDKAGALRGHNMLCAWILAASYSRARVKAKKEDSGQRLLL